jgi:hypothetical protein
MIDMTWRISPDGHIAVSRRHACSCSASGCRLSDALYLFLQFCRNLFRIGVVQVADLGIAAAFERSVQVRDQGLDPEALRRFARDEHAITTVVRDDLDLHGTATFSRGTAGGKQGVDDPDDLARARVLQLDDVDVAIARLVDTRNDPHDPVHVVGAIRDDQDV